MPFLTLNGANIYYELYGTDRSDRSPIVLIHGSTMTGRADWQAIAPFLIEDILDRLPLTSLTIAMDEPALMAGWTREQAAHLIPRLKQYDIEFVEQPLAAGDIEGLRRLKQQHCGVPVFADESLKTSRDIARPA